MPYGNSCSDSRPFWEQRQKTDGIDGTFGEKSVDKKKWDKGTREAAHEQAAGKTNTYSKAEKKHIRTTRHENM